MSVKTFAAIDVGSFEMAMKIYELSEKNGLKEIDYVRHRLSLGTDSYNTGKISFSKIDELCNVLVGFKNIMKSYKVNDYKAYGTSALRETANAMIIQDQIKNRTGIKVEILSNSELRFLDYKSVASKGKEFNDIITNRSTNHLVFNGQFLNGERLKGKIYNENGKLEYEYEYIDNC